MRQVQPFMAAGEQGDQLRIVICALLSAVVCGEHADFVRNPRSDIACHLCPSPVPADELGGTTFGPYRRRLNAAKREPDLPRQCRLLVAWLSLSGQVTILP